MLTHVLPLRLHDAVSAMLTVSAWRKNFFCMHVQCLVESAFKHFCVHVCLLEISDCRRPVGRLAKRTGKPGHG